MKLSKFLIVGFFAMFIAIIQVKAQGDDCSSAVNLPNLTKYCSNPKQFTNVTSTVGTYGVASCWPGTATYDVWFKFTAIGTDVQLSAAGGGTNGTIKMPSIALYGGSCSGTINELACTKATSDVTSLYKGGLIPGTVYLVRISTTSANRGTFQFCISNYSPTVNPGADCDGAVKLCDKTVVKVAGLSGGGKNNAEIEASSCFNDATSVPATESNSSWFKWTCAKAGTLTFDIAPIDPTNDLDFILYELSGTSTNACGTRTIIRCTATACPVPNGIVGLNMTATDVSEIYTNTSDPNACNSPALNGYLKYVDMTVGKTYVLMVNNFDAASGFTITFGGSGIFLGPSAKIVATGTPTTCVGEPVIYNGSNSNNYNALLWTFKGGSPTTATTVGPHTVTYSTKGTYTTYLKASDASCASGNSTDSVKVTVNDATTISNAGSAQTVCGTTATLAANTATAGTGTWVLVSGQGTITSPNSPTSTVTGLGIGPNVFRWTISNPPCSSTTSTVTITGTGIPSTANAGADQIICGGTSAPLSGNIPTMGTGKWTVVSGSGTIASPTSPNTTVTALGLGNNIFRWSISNAPCSDAFDDVTIKRVDLPVIDTTLMVVKMASCNVNDGAITKIKVTASSALTYQWNTVSYPTADITNIPAGSYTLVVKDADGCSATMGPISVVNPGAPTKPIIVSGGNVCVGQPIKVWVKNPLTGVNYTWTGPNGNPLGVHDTVYITSTTATDMGNYSATGSLMGCVGSTGSANVVVNALPKPIITGTMAICPGSTTIFSAVNSIPGGTATSITTYQWVYNGKPIVPSNTPTINVTKEGDYKLIITNSNGCVDSTTKSTLKFNAPPVIDETAKIIDSTDCNSSTGSITNITATGVPVLNYMWYSPPATPVPGGTTADLMNMPAGNYYLVVTDGNGCKDTSKTFTIHDHHTPSSPGVLNNKPYCAGDVLEPIEVNGSGGIYVWYDKDMNKIFTGSPYTPIITSTDTLYVTETVNNCVSLMDTVIVTINPLPTGNAGPDKHILCSGPTITLDGTGSTGSPYVYSWIPASGIASGGTTLTPAVKDAGTYTLTVKNSKTGCFVTDAVTVIKDPVPAASFTADPMKGEAPLTVKFNNTSSGSDVYLWDFDDKNTSSDKDPTNIFVNAGDYHVKLTVSDKGACPSIMYADIHVYEKLVYILPNVFTPNGDGKNDVYTITSTGIEGLQGEIYDRWGLKLFTWNQKNDGWDGRSPSGGLVPDGVYFYIIKIIPQDRSKEALVEKGQVTLLR
jgi:gliding motility-associated-like protein